MVYISKIDIIIFYHFLLLPIRIEHFGGRLGHISFNWGVRSWRHVAHIGRAVGAIGGGRRDSVGARNGCYAASEPVLRLRQGQVLIGDATCRRIAISRSVKTVSSGSSLKSVAITAGEVSVLAELVIVLTADRVAIVAALNRFRDQIFVNSALRVLIAAAADAAVDVRRCFRRRRD